MHETWTVVHAGSVHNVEDSNTTYSKTTLTKIIFPLQLYTLRPNTELFRNSLIFSGTFILKLYS